MSNIGTPASSGQSHAEVRNFWGVAVLISCYLPAHSVQSVCRLAAVQPLRVPSYALTETMNSASILRQAHNHAITALAVVAPITCYINHVIPRALPAVTTKPDAFHTWAILTILRDCRLMSLLSWCR